MLSINKELQIFSANLPWGKCRNREGVYSYFLSPTTILRKVCILAFRFDDLNPFRCFADDATCTKLLALSAPSPIADRPRHSGRDAQQGPESVIPCYGPITSQCTIYLDIVRRE